MNSVQEWREGDIEQAAGELAREYPHAPLSRIILAARLAVRAVPPEAGRVKLLCVARRHLMG